MVGGIPRDLTDWFQYNLRLRDKGARVELSECPGSIRRWIASSCEGHLIGQRLSLGTDISEWFLQPGVVRSTG